MKHLRNYIRYRMINEGFSYHQPTQEEIEEFWNFVDKADWKSDHDYDRIKQFLLDNYSKQDIKKLENTYRYFLDDLDARFREDWLGEPGINVSDDGWWDLRADVIGRGEEFYNNVTAEKLKEIADNNTYKENFGYCFNIR